MPVISKIGARSFKVRMVYTTMLVVLIIGALTMIYPFMLMISGSMKSNTDFVWITPVPRYFLDDDILWMKYLESKYERESKAEIYLRRYIGSFRMVTPPENVDADLVREFLEFREQHDWPKEWFTLGHVQFDQILAKNARLYRRRCQDEFDDDIKAFSEAIGVRYNTWAQIGPPALDPANTRCTFPGEPNFQVYYQFKAEAPKADWIPCDLDGDFVKRYLLPYWSSVEAYNKAHGTKESS